MSNTVIKIGGDKVRWRVAVALITAFVVLIVIIRALCLIY
jgi:hypothetical protein